MRRVDKAERTEVVAVELQSDCPDFDDLVIASASQPVLIGRSRSATYRLSHPQISGTQCSLSFVDEPPRLQLRDLSSNGTFVDGKEIGRNQSVYLSHGNLITFLVPTVEDRDLDYGDEIPAFHVIVRRAPKLAPIRAELSAAERLHAPSTSSAASFYKHNAPSADGISSYRQTSPCARKSEPAQARVLRKRPQSAVNMPTPSMSSRRRRLQVQTEQTSRTRDGSIEPCSLLLSLPSDLIWHVLSALDTPSMLRMSCVCTWLQAETANAYRLSLRALRTPLTLERSATFFSRFRKLGELSLVGPVLARDGAPGILSALLPGLRSLVVRENELTTRGCAALASALNRAPSGSLELEKLDLSSSQIALQPELDGHTFSDLAASSLVEKLDCVKSSLTYLSLADNRLTAMVAEVLTSGKLLRNSSALRYLDLSGNFLGNEGVGEIASALTEPWRGGLTQLRLDRTFAGDTAAIHIAGMLEVNSSLLQLSLASNDIQHLGANVIANSLKSNESLVELDLSYCMFLMRATHNYTQEDTQARRQLRAPHRHNLSVYLYTI